MNVVLIGYKVCLFTRCSKREGKNESLRKEEMIPSRSKAIEIRGDENHTINMGLSVDRNKTTFSE